MSKDEYIEELEAAIIDTLSGLIPCEIVDMSEVSIERAVEIYMFVEEVREKYEKKHGIES